VGYIEESSQTLSGDPLMRRCIVLLASDAKVSAVRMTWRGSYCLWRRLVMSQGSLYTPASMFLKSCSGKTTDSVSHGVLEILFRQDY